MVNKRDKETMEFLKTMAVGIILATLFLTAVIGILYVIIAFPMQLLIVGGILAFVTFAYLLGMGFRKGGV